MRRLLFVLIVLSLCGSAHAERMRFRCGELMVWDADGDSTAYAYYDTSYVGMVTICSSKPDSSIGFREIAVGSKHHYIGFPSSQMTQLGVGDTTRTAIRFDVEVLPDSASIESAILWLYQYSRALTTPNGIFLAVDPIAPAFAWENNHTIGGRGASPFQPAGTGPTWFEYENGGGTWSVAGADSAQLQVDRVANDRFVGGSGVWINVHHTSAQAWYPIDVTAHFNGILRDSVDISNAGWLLSLDIGGGVSDNDWVQIVDHLCSAEQYRPYLDITYFDTTHVRTTPQRLGSSGLDPPKTYLDVKTRRTVGRFAFLSDYHLTGCGLEGYSFNDMRRVITYAASLYPKPDAIFCGGDLCCNAKRSGEYPDSLLSVYAWAESEGLPLYLALGNWDSDVEEELDIFKFCRQFVPTVFGSRYYAIDLGFALVACLQNNTGFTEGIVPASTQCTDDSLSKWSSVQSLWLQKTAGERTPEQAFFTVMHKNVAAALESGARPNLRSSADYRGRADTLCWQIESVGSWANLAGHQHGYTSTPPLRHDCANDTIDFVEYPSETSDILVRVDKSDSACVYITAAAGFVTQAPTVNETIRDRGWIRRWDHHTEPYIAIIDVFGDFWQLTAIDTTGAVFDTLLVQRL